MHHRQLGRTGIAVSEIGFGTWSIGGKDWGPTDDRVSLRAIDKAIDVGITFFDTADHYGNGHSEELLGQALAGKRDRVVIASKGGILPDASKQDFSAAHLSRALETSLRRLRTDAIDLYFLHNPTADHMRQGECFDALRRFKAEGKIRSWGVSIRPPFNGWRKPPSGASGDPVDDARLAMDLADPDAIQIVFNMIERRAATIFDEASRRGTAIVARVPLARGLLAGKFTPETSFPPGDFRRAWPRAQFLAELRTVERLQSIVAPTGLSMVQAALAFPISFPQVTTTIPGARNENQVVANAEAAAHRPLDRRALDAIMGFVAA